MEKIGKPEITRTKINGPLRVHKENPRYFADRDGKAVLLTGSHNWSNIQEIFSPDEEKEFDYRAYLEWLAGFGHNYTRGWHWEATHWNGFTRPGEFSPVRPLPYARTGPGTALDDGPKFDLTRYNQNYFDRLRHRVIEAGDYGIYFSVMLFQGFSVDRRAEHPTDNPWDGHPFNRANNINGIDGSAGNPEGGRAIHTLKIPEVTRLQEAYVRKIIDTVNDLDNVIYEIGNEHYEESFEWQCHMVNYIRGYEKTKPKQHLIGMTSGGGSNDAVTNSQLFSSPADWIAPRQNNEDFSASYMDDPPVNNGRKVIVADTDHLWGVGGNIGWAWKSFMRGLHTALMDPYEPLHGLENYAVWAPLNFRNHPAWDPVRRNMGYTRYFAERVNLAAMIPRPELASSRYCLAQYGREYLVYVPQEKEICIDLGEGGGFSVVWLDTQTGMLTEGDHITGKGELKLNVPVTGSAVVLLRKKERRSEKKG